MMTGAVGTRTVAVLLLFALGLTTGGCLVMAGSNTSYEGKGAFVGQKTLDQIEPGKTTKEWVVSVLGKPTKTTQAGPDTEIMEYEYVRKQNDGFCVFLIVAAGNTKEKRQRLYIEVKEGVVQKYWMTGTEA